MPSTSGLLVVEIEVDSPAVAIGIEAGDIILEIDHTPIKDMASFKRKLLEFKEGETSLLLIDRDGWTLFVTPRHSKLVFFKEL